jgi:hypothetical protein
MKTMNLTSDRTEKSTVLVLSIWGLMAFIGGASGLFQHLPAPSIGLVLAGATLLIWQLYLRRERLRNWMDQIPLRVLTLFHFWRIIGGLAFLYYADSLPFTFALEAGIGDIVSGVAAILVFIFYQKRIGFIVFNVIGMLDLILALSMGIYLALSGDEMVFGLAAPQFTFILTFAVPILLVTHFVSIRKLLNKKYQ